MVRAEVRQGASRAAGRGSAVTVVPDWVDDPGVGLDEVLRRFTVVRGELDRANAAIARVKTVRDDLYRRPHCAEFADEIDIALDGDDDA